MGAGAAVVLGRTVVSLLLAGALALVVNGIGARADDAERDKAVDSPARAILLEPCAEYRTVLRRQADSGDAGPEFLTWVRSNQGAFDEAARLDPALAPAAASIRALNAYFTSVFAGGPRLSADERHALDNDMMEACLRGPGRA